LQRTHGNRATAEWLGGLASFPHAAEIGPALRPKSPLVGVLDPEGCAERNTPGFTEGNVSHFASRDVGLHVAAHEAVHQLQHRGETRDAGLGPEGHANAVADSVVAGVSPGLLLGARGRAVPSATRGWLDADMQGDTHQKPDATEETGIGNGRLSETGETLTIVRTPHQAWATDHQIETANAAFRALDSGISLAKTGDSMDVQKPGSRAVNKLHCVDVRFAHGAYEDCGRMAREIMARAGADRPAGVRASPGGLGFSGPDLATDQQSPKGHVALILDMDAAMQKAGGSDKEKKKAGEEVLGRYQKLTPSVDTDHAFRDTITQRGALSDEDQKRMGIDQYASPWLGEAYAIAPAEREGNQFPYHWAAVVFVAGSDRVVLEAAAGKHNQGDYDNLNDGWMFQTYGTRNKKQTFQTAWEGKMGKYEHTVAMASSLALPSDIVSFGSTSGASLFERYDEAGRSHADQYYVKKELWRRDVVVAVTVVKASHSSKVDEVGLVFPPTPDMPLGPATHTQKISEGESREFTMPIVAIWPLGRPLTIWVWVDAQHIGSNEVQAIKWDWPYETSKGRVEGQGAIYDLELYIQ
jgi:hypothetical protein